MHLGGLLAAVASLLVLAPAAMATTQSRDEASDAPTGASGKADLRHVAWNVGASSATLTVGVDAST
ncbi:MAG: hypothetical protein QOF57_2001, partial [Frankiaceae bacterium]|nr:hypothetical protein [Frankiaceae bacterium]